MMTISYAQAVDRFRQIFSTSPACVARAPGRVNLIGDHTDYTGGLVLPIAIDRGFWIAAGPTSGNTVDVYSESFAERASVPLSSEIPGELQPRWARYLAGVIALLLRRGEQLRGTVLWIGGDLAPGAGLSSSAALEVGCALALLEVAGRSLPRMELAQLCQRAENEFAGSPCGLMDQLCCTCAQAGHALLLDCASLEMVHVPLPVDTCKVMVIDSGVRHSIAGAEYATRRQECARALEILRRVEPRVNSLRDLPAKPAVPHCDQLGDILTRRVRHVVTENERVRQLAQALRDGDLPRCGKLMSESHASLRDDYEVSCPELDDIVELARGVEGVHGARMTGGGFGGCVVALVQSNVMASLADALQRDYDPSHTVPATSSAVESSPAAQVTHL